MFLNHIYSTSMYYAPILIFLIEDKMAKEHVIYLRIYSLIKNKQSKNIAI